MMMIFDSPNHYSPSSTNIRFFHCFFIHFFIDTHTHYRGDGGGKGGNMVYDLNHDILWYRLQIKMFCSFFS